MTQSVSSGQAEEGAAPHPTTWWPQSGLRAGVLPAVAGDTRPPGGHQPGQPAAPVQSHLMTHSNLHVAFFLLFLFKENVIKKKTFKWKACSTRTQIERLWLTRLPMLLNRSQTVKWTGMLRWSLNGEWNNSLRFRACLKLDHKLTNRAIIVLWFLNNDSSSFQVRFAALITVLALAEKLRENYIVLLPESIPFLAELMEGNSQTSKK